LPNGIPELVLKDDDSFSVKNLPVLTGFTDAARPEGELINGDGGWSLSRIDEQTLKLVLDFEGGSVQSGDLMLLVDVVESPEKGLMILYWISDPDLAQVLEFNRTSGLYRGAVFFNSNNRTSAGLDEAPHEPVVPCQVV
jgi:hypothetical protein